ncbi:hypothetical protein CDL12_14464 [Handroanthus impetiginosus]|uniref:non-specific serine/threonine protein kinase n=1 Tax=Handroanthus impetiginosus TaxID=429701 RepID=A0A2G9H5X1_9LAMI|nr:hypothetical protein CDL12_14464 [Handroanthus impetiginosus]
MTTLFTIIFHLIAPLIIITISPRTTLSLEPACKTHCGSLEIKYPLGTGHGCGSPRFHPYVACSSDGNHFLLTTHTGIYPITSISYSTSVITIAPPCMSNCTFMLPSPTNFGLDWPSPFQIGPSTFILLACSAAAVDGNPICDPSSIYLCPSIYNCPGVVSLGLPPFPSTNTCCVYSPANLDSDDELDLRQLKCAGYSSVLELGEVPADAQQWRFGVALKYTLGGLDGYNIAPSCHGCEMSGGVCGYAPPANSFVCVCESGNTTTDCYSFNWIIMSSSLRLNGDRLGTLAVISVLLIVI